MVRKTEDLMAKTDDTATSYTMSGKVQGLVYILLQRYTTSMLTVSQAKRLTQ
jgi:hypothetical protein